MNLLVLKRSLVSPGAAEVVLRHRSSTDRINGPALVCPDPRHIERDAEARR
jgi:hypothetical protein